MTVFRQHLIDPEICIRCNTCEETCPVGAITHDDNNYVVNAEKCNFCMNCISPCPTGSIDNWRMVTQPYPTREQFSWNELPAETHSGDMVQQQANESEASRLLEAAHSGEGARVLPPQSAASPYINIFNRTTPMVAKVTGNIRITDKNTASDIHHIIIDFGQRTFPVLEGQSVGIIVPGQDENGHAHLIRLYSVASARDGERLGANNMALTVKRVVYKQGNQTKYGVASNYLCNLKKGDKIKLTGPFGSTFLMPNHESANILMICTGTGAAPFRAMTEYRRRHMAKAKGSLTLYFGARSPGELPYFGPLRKLDDRFIDKQLVFSRLPDTPREYVQDRMLRHSRKMAGLLRSQETYVYMCGLKGMEQGVEKVFKKICENHDLDWSNIKSEMRHTGRYHIETY